MLMDIQIAGGYRRHGNCKVAMFLQPFEAGTKKTKQIRGSSKQELI